MACSIQGCFAKAVDSSGFCLVHKPFFTELGLTQTEPEGKKSDEGKTRWDLMCWELLEAAARIMTKGAADRGDYNYKNVENGKTRYFSALVRHTMQWLRGEEKDKDSGESHLAHMICNCMILWELGHK